MPNPSDNPFYNSATGMIPTWARGGGSPTPTPANNSVAASMAGFSPYASPSRPSGPPSWQPMMGGSPGYTGIPSNMRVLPSNYQDFYLPGQQVPQDAQRYSQATSPMSTFFRQMERAYTPWGPAVQDRPAAGFAGGGVGAVGRRLPKVGGLVGAIEAAMNASGKEGQWFPQPEESWWKRLLGVAGNTMGMLPSPIGGEALSWTRTGVGALRALSGAPEYLNRTFGDMMATGAGAGVRSAWDRLSGGGPGASSEQPSWMQTGIGGVPFYGGGEGYGGYAPEGNNFASSMIPSSYFQEERGGS